MWTFGPLLPSTPLGVQLPTITSVGGGSASVDTRTGVTIVGTNFGGSTGEVWVSTNSTLGVGTDLRITVTAWADTSLTVSLTENGTGNPLDDDFTLPGTLYFFVKDSTPTTGPSFAVTVSPAGATWQDALNTDVGADVSSGNVGGRIRVLIENTGGAATTPSFKWRAKRNGGALFDITASSSYITTNATSYFVDGDDCGVALIGANALITNNNAAEESTGTFTLPVDFTGSADIEAELSYLLVAADLADADTIDIYVSLSDGTALDTYTEVPRITVTKSSGGGTATVDGSGSLIGSAVLLAAGAGSLDGVGTISADGIKEATGAGSLDGVGTISANGIREAPGAGSLDGTGDIAGAAALRAAGAASLDGSGDIAADGEKLQASDTATVPGTGDLAADAVLLAVGAGSLDGVGNIAADGIREALGSGALDGTGTVAAPGVLLAVGSGSLDGAGGLAVDGIKEAPGAGSLDGAGDLAAGATLLAAGSASLDGSGDIAADGIKPATGDGVEMSSDGTLAGDGALLAVGSGSLDGVGSISDTGAALAAGAAALDGVGAQDGAGLLLAAGATTLPGDGSLSADGQKEAPGAGSFDGQGDLAAAGVILAQGAGVLPGQGDLAADGIKEAPGAATVVGTGAIDGAGTTLAAGVASLTGDGAVAGAAVVIAAGEVSLDGVGSLIGVPEDRGSSQMLGQGDLVGVGRAILVGSLDAQGAGDIVTQSTVRAAGSASLDGIGDLAAAGSVQAQGAGLLGGDGDLVGGQADAPAAVALPGQGQITPAIGGFVGPQAPSKEWLEFTREFEPDQERPVVVGLGAGFSAKVTASFLPAVREVTLRVGLEFASRQRLEYSTRRSASFDMGVSFLASRVRREFDENTRASRGLVGIESETVHEATDAIIAVVAKQQDALQQMALLGEI
jgi:hypothetical protein